MSAVSTHGGGVRVWCSRFDRTRRRPRQPAHRRQTGKGFHGTHCRTRSNGNFVHLLPERLATSRIWSRCHEGFPALQATGQKRVLTRDDNL